MPPVRRDDAAAVAPAKRRGERSGAQTRGAESPRKVLRLLLSFSPQRPTATVEELARDIGVPMSTAYRYVALLREVGLLEEGRHGLYHVSPLAIQLAQSAIMVQGIVDIARPTLKAIRDETGETALLVRRIGQHVICVDRAESAHPVRLSFEIGQPLPIHAGASAKVLLANMPSRELDLYLENLPDRLKDAQRRQSLLKQLPAIREHGWALSEEEVDPGVWAAAAAVSNGHEVVAALSVAGPAYRFDAAARERTLAIVRRGAAEISAALSPLHV